MVIVKLPLRDHREVLYERSLQEDLDDAMRFADSIGKRDSLEDALSRVAYPKFFGKPARTFIYGDFAPFSFGFSVQIQDPDGAWKFAMNGGVIWHESSQGWSVHT